MSLQRYVIRPRSPWSMRLRSDTLAGLLLGNIAERDGEEAVARAIGGFRNGHPPFVVSSAMPKGFLPFPKLDPMPREIFRERFGGDLVPALRDFKRFRKLAWIPLERWMARRGALSSRALFEDFRAGRLAGPGEMEKADREPHVSMNRATGRALDGGLFFAETLFFHRDAAFHVYVEADDHARLLAGLRDIGILGFGRDAGTGRGRFDVEPDTDFRPEDLASPPGEGAVRHLLLSFCAAPRLSAPGGCWAMEVKRGRTGPVMGANPFKRPFLGLQEGSILADPPEARPLEGIHARPEVIQAALPLTLPCILEDVPPQAAAGA